MFYLKILFDVLSNALQRGGHPSTYWVIFQSWRPPNNPAVDPVERNGGPTVQIERADQLNGYRLRRVQMWAQVAVSTE